MKKRVNQSEIEVARKSSRVLFLISFILLVFLFLGFGVIYVLNVDVSRYINVKVPTSTKKSSKPDTIIKHGVVMEPSTSPIDVDISDSNVQAFYQVVKVTNPDVCLEGGYREKKQVDVAELDDKCKFSIASKIYEKSVKQGLDGKLFVNEDEVKKAYDGLYGNGTYKQQDSIPCLYKTNFIYHGDYYFTESVAAEESSSLVSYEKILSANRESNQLNITSVVVYYEKVLSLLCKDSRCEKSIESVRPGAEYGDDYLDLYVSLHRDELYQYTYHFRMDSAGFYRYTGYERTNE